MTTFATVRRTLSATSPSTAALAARALWSMYCVARSARALRHPDHAPASPTGPKLGIVIPLLDEADRVPALIDHWHQKLLASPRLVVYICTTEREAIEADDRHRTRTWDAVTSHRDFAALAAAGRAHLLHHPTANRTYGEQLRWALAQLTDDAITGLTHLYVANVDTRLSDQATNDLLRHVDNGARCAQQSALFFANLKDLNGPAAAEALYQSRWTLEREYFRYLAGSEQIRWLPTPLARRWYQHAVGHGLLISIDFLGSIGGLPAPRHGLEDAALGFKVRALGHSIQPMTTLECGEAPTNIGELQRQRMTWIRGPLCAPEYSSLRRNPALIAQGLYDALKWALGLPALATLLARKQRTDRTLALTALAIELYGPAIATIAAVQHLEIDRLCRPSPAQFAKALAWYPAAPVNYTIGGFRGLVALLAELATDTTWTQPRTRDATTQPTE